MSEHAHNDRIKRSLNGCKPLHHLHPGLGAEPLQAIAIEKLECDQTHAATVALDSNISIIERARSADFHAAQEIELDDDTTACWLYPRKEKHVGIEVSLPIVPRVRGKAMDVVKPYRRRRYQLQDVSAMRLCSSM